ncbi:MAG: hypothetical protein FJ319_08430 [SAR202 cluster bacterium]|nr:hypothetical protein [SAR202 cluster bacterium]
MLPPRGTGEKVVKSRIDAIAALAASGLAEAVDITDGSRGIPLMPPGDFISLARRGLGDAAAGIEMIAHFTGRDLNTMGIQGRLVGYHHMGIRNILFVTGDPPNMSPGYPRSTAVFDLDSVEMVRLAQQYLNAGLDFGGRPLNPIRTSPGPAGDDVRRGGQVRDGTAFTVGSGFEPEALDGERELGRLRAKIDAGADYIMTQPAFRHEPLAAMEPFRRQVPILVGVMVLTSLEQARRVGETPGVVIPQAVYDRLAAFQQPEDQAKVGRDIAIEHAQWVRANGWPGLYLMSPSSTAMTIEVLKALAE